MRRDAAFDAATVGWIAAPDDARRALEDAAVEVLGLISNASNTTLLCRLDCAGLAEDLFAVYKPADGERPLWDFPDGLYRREVAAYEVSQFLGWGVVPPTVVRDAGEGEGSLQLFVPHDPTRHYFELVKGPTYRAALARIGMFDLVVNNADRKGGHVLLGTRDDRLYGIDNGLTFHPQPKLRTVIWEVSDVAFEPSWREDLWRLSQALRDDDDPSLQDRLEGLLGATEMTMLAKRAELVAAMTSLPSLARDERPYPWPPL